MSTETLVHLIPEIVLIATAVSIYVAGAFAHTQEYFSWIAGGAILVAAVGLLTPVDGGMGLEHAAVGGPVTADALAHYARWFALAAGALLVVLTSRVLAGGGTSEYVGSLLLVIAGVMLAAEAGNLVQLFVSLELISIPTYLLLYLGRRGPEVQEAAAKYFFLSVFASAILVYGFSYLYGSAGSTQLAVIAERLVDLRSLYSGMDVLTGLALVLIFAGLSFKIAAIPFHFYAPDVYQGTTYGNAALLSVAPKAAGFFVLVRLAGVCLPGLAAYGWQIAVLISALTMTLANTMALWQDNLRRLLAYSSIAHAGYMLIGFAVALGGGAGGPRWNAVGALLFYLCVYSVATIGAFAALGCLRRAKDADVLAVDELAGLGSTRPLMAAAMAVFMFSLAGVPPLAGFWGKLAVFASALSGGAVGAGPRVWFVTLAVIGVLNAAVAAAYYLRIVAVMYFRTPLAVPKPDVGAGSWWAALICAGLTVVIGLLPGPLLSHSNAVGSQVLTGPSIEGEVPDDLAAFLSVPSCDIQQGWDSPLHGRSCPEPA